MLERRDSGVPAGRVTASGGRPLPRGGTLRRLGRVLTRRQHGFTMAEVLVALVVFEIVGASLVALLNSTTAVTGLARQRTVAQQAALSQIESIRTLEYDAVGIANGNPAGCLGVTSTSSRCPNTSYPPASTTIQDGGLVAALATSVSYVNDPGPLSYTSYANYKKVVVTVTRTRDSKLLAHEVTYVAPPVKADESNAVIKVTVIDYGNNAPVANVPVALSTGPSAPESDIADAAGAVTFAGLAPNPTSGPQASYDLGVTPPIGYVTLYDTVSPSAPAHTQLVPGETWPTTLDVYRPATIYVQLQNFDGTTYAGTATVAVGYTRKSTQYSQNFSYTGSPLTITSMNEGSNTVSLVPGLAYTVSVTGSAFYEVDPATGQPEGSVTANVPDAYPSVLSHTFVARTAQVATVNVTVTNSNNGACRNATATLAGGPFGGAPWSFSLSGSTSGSGAPAVFNPTGPGVPVGAGYSITGRGAAWPYSTKTLTGQTVAAGTNNITVKLSSSTC